MPPSVDPLAIRAELERQLAFLVPVVGHLRHAAADRSVLVDDEWRGPAADAAAGFLVELQSRLRDAEEVADDAVRTLRLQIALLS